MPKSGRKLGEWKGAHHATDLLVIDESLVGSYLLGGVGQRSMDERSSFYNQINLETNFKRKTSLRLICNLNNAFIRDDKGD